MQILQRLLNLYQKNRDIISSSSDVEEEGAEWCECSVKVFIGRFSSKLVSD